MDLTDERIARNQSTFRDANERIEEAAEKHALPGDVPFICECAEATCSQILLLSLDEYERIRANPRHFLVAPGHAEAAGEAAHIVEEHPTWVLAEKVGRAGEIAARLDPRTDEQASSTG
jgi:hypothetical protein